MPRVTYDSNIFIKHKPAHLPAGFYMSVVVLQELVAGARDSEATKELEAAYRNYKKASRLLVPDIEDWWQVGVDIKCSAEREKIEEERADTKNIDRRKISHYQ